MKKVVFYIYSIYFFILAGMAVLTLPQFASATRSQSGMPGVYNATPLVLPSGDGSALAVDSKGMMILSTTTVFSVNCTGCGSSVSSTQLTLNPGPLYITNGTSTTTISGVTSSTLASGLLFWKSGDGSAAWPSPSFSRSGKDLLFHGQNEPTSGVGGGLLIILGDGNGSSNDGALSVKTSQGVEKMLINPTNGGNADIVLGSTVSDNFQLNAAYAYANNRSTVSHNINITGTDATVHEHLLSIDGLTSLSCKATGNGAGSVGATTCYLGYESATLDNQFGINTPSPSSTLHIINYAVPTTTVWIGDLSTEAGVVCLGTKKRGTAVCAYAGNSTWNFFSTTTY